MQELMILLPPSNVRIPIKEIIYSKHHPDMSDLCQVFQTAWKSAQ